MTEREQAAKARESASAAARRERWLRVGVKRTDRVLEALDVLAKCGNRSSYAFEESEVESVFDAITHATLRAREAFRPRQRREREPFSLPVEQREVQEA